MWDFSFSVLGHGIITVNLVPLEVEKGPWERGWSIVCKCVSDRSRMNMAKRGRDFSMEDSNSDTETDREEPAEKIAPKYDGAEVNQALKGILSQIPLKGVYNRYRYIYIYLACSYFYSL